MPIYVYGCNQDRSHPRKEVTHGMKESPAVKCVECGSKMHKVPQPMRFHMSGVLLNWMDENYTRYRARKKGYNKPRFSPDNVMQPGSGIPQKNFQARKKEL